MSIQICLLSIFASSSINIHNQTSKEVMKRKKVWYILYHGLFYSLVSLLFDAQFIVTCFCQVKYPDYIALCLLQFGVLFQRHSQVREWSRGRRIRVICYKCDALIFSCTENGSIIEKRIAVGPIQGSVHLVLRCLLPMHFLYILSVRESKHGWKLSFPGSPKQSVHLKQLLTIKYGLA